MKKLKTTAVIVAAGSGVRMGSIAKPLIKLGGITVFERVIAAFNASETIDDIIIVCRDEEQYRSLIPKKCKPINLTAGGATRSGSVYNGVMTANCDYICVHDCARPFIKSGDIDLVVKEAHKNGAASACSLVTDTIKFIDRESGVLYTPDRDFLRAIQTPQVIKKDIYITASAMATQNNLKATDETAIIENAGFKVEYVDIGTYNFKLTDKDDVIRAKATVFLEGRKSDEDRSRV